MNLGSLIAICIVQASPSSEVHGIASFRHGLAFSDPKSHQVKHYSSVSGVSVLAGNGTEGRGRGSAKSSNFMQPSGLCSELDSNLFLCDLASRRDFHHHRT